VLRRHCDAVGRDFGDILLTAGYFADPFGDVDEYLRTVDRYSELRIDLINTGPVPGNPDPEVWVERFGDQALPVSPPDGDSPVSPAHRSRFGGNTLQQKVIRIGESPRVARARRPPVGS